MDNARDIQRRIHGEIAADSAASLASRQNTILRHPQIPAGVLLSLVRQLGAVFNKLSVDLVGPVVVITDAVRKQAADGRVAQKLIQIIAVRRSPRGR